MSARLISSDISPSSILTFSYTHPRYVSLLREPDLPILPSSELDVSLTGVKRKGSEILDLVETGDLITKRSRKDYGRLCLEMLCADSSQDFDYNKFEELSEEVKSSMTHTGSRPSSREMSPIRRKAEKMPRERVVAEPAVGLWCDRS